MTYAAADLLEEVAYVAHAYSWQLDSVLDLEHPDRATFLDAAARLGGQPAGATTYDS